MFAWGVGYSHKCWVKVCRPSYTADPGFSEGVGGGGGSDKRPSTDYLIVFVLMFCLTNPFFTRKKYSQNTYVCFTLRGSTEVLEPPLRRRASMGHICKWRFVD